MDKWIVSKDELPVDGEDVLGVVEEMGVRYRAVVVWDSRDECWTENLNPLGSLNVTHWMKLPALPQ